MRARSVAFTFALLLIAAMAGPTAGAQPAGEWHRLNPDPTNVANEHERLQCTEREQHWSCFYDKLPEPGYHVDGTVGMFQGRNVTASWECPSWFPDEICDNVVAVYEGPAIYFPDGGGTFRVMQAYVVTEIDGQEVLFQYWIDQFVCPWFRTFDEAKDANPTSQFDCTFA